MLWDDFLNSDYHDWRGTGKSEDRLDNPEWLAKWLTEHDLPNPGLPSSQDMKVLKLLRMRILQMVQNLLADNKVNPEDVAELNKALLGGPIIHRLEMSEVGVRLNTVRLRNDWEGIRADIADSFAHTLAEGEPSRFGICNNPDCLWVYYDETRNRSKRFCDDKMCGNLMKVRRFRARKKAAGSTVPQGMPPTEGNG
jgi:predicted RNA-binding Zn ribbon-like protein